MEYILFDEYITLQSLFKEIGLIQSGGAIKAYLAETEVLFNGEKETRRGKKCWLNDVITIPSENLEITMVAPTEEERQEHLADLEEKKRVQALVKKMNQANKKQQGKQGKAKPKNVGKKAQKPAKKAVKFPGT